MKSATNPGGRKVNFNSETQTKTEINNFKSGDYGLVGDKINIDEYGSIGFGPDSISSGIFGFSSASIFSSMSVLILSP